MSLPTSPPRPSDPVDGDELKALVEALIEEARQRARRRRRRNAAWILLAVLAVGALAFGLDRGGGSGAAPGARASGGGAATAAPNARERWGQSHGPDGAPAFAVAVAPSAPRYVYLGTKRGVFRSTNGGRSWTSAGLAGPASRLAVPGASGVTSLAVDPRSPTTVYAGLNGRWVGGTAYGEAVYKTADGGRSWHALGLRGQLVAIGPAGPPTIYAATGGPGGTSRLVRSSDGGRSWQRSDIGLPSTYLWALAVDPSARATVYAAMGRRGAFESRDSGGSWRALGIPERYGPVTAIAVDPAHPRTVFAGTDAGVVRSQDGGRSWRIVNATLGAHGRDRWYGQVAELLVDARHPQTLYATTMCTGVFRSTDGGRRWSAANVGLHPSCWATYPLALDPRAPQTLYAAEPARGVLESVDAGAHWQVANRGLGLTQVSALAVDPASRTVYAGTRSLGLFVSADGGRHWRRPRGPGLALVTGVAVDPRAHRNVLVAGAPNAITRSTDAGRTWTETPLGPGTATVVAMSGGTAYAGASGGRLFGSTDAGRSWRALGRLGGFVEALAIGPGHPAVVYAAVSGAGASPGGLFESTDGGRRWVRLTPGPGVDVTAIVLDPRAPSTVYVGTAEGAVLESTDGGATWRTAGAGLEPGVREASGVTALAVDPVHPTRLYAAIGGRGVFTSTDAGWHAVNAGPADLDVTALALDATDRSLYAGTAGGGVVRLRRST